MFNFLEDVVVYSRSVAEHVAHVREVLVRLQAVGFTLNQDKVTFVAPEIKYLGHILSCHGIRMLRDRVEVIKNNPRPTNLRTLRKFFCMMGFYDRFIPDFSSQASVLHALKKKVVRFV